MLSDSDLRDLLSYQASSPVLSVYLNTEPEAGNADVHRLHLRSMLKEVDLPVDVSLVIHYIEQEHDWSGRSVILFSCSPESYFKVYSLAVPVRSRVRIGDHPYVKPLANLLDSYGGYGVVLVDKQGARLFHFHLGELREQVGFLGEEVRHTKSGGGSSATGRRGGTVGRTSNVDEVADRNMRETLDFAIRFFRENNVRRLLIGGTDENVALFRGMLPKAWQSLVVGTFPANMIASHSEILEKSMQIGLKAELQRETKLVETVITEASKGRAGVLGLDHVLDNVREGRIHILVIRDGYRLQGYECQGCGYLTTQSLDTCPFCGNTFSKIPDAVEMAVRNVMQAGGDVEVLQADQGPVADSGRTFDIGALLRY
jgi:peptide chain release factor subunit 1